jgi:hypothetical protein
VRNFAVFFSPVSFFLFDEPRDPASRAISTARSSDVPLEPETAPATDPPDDKVAAVSADARALAEAKVAKFLLHGFGLSDRELPAFRRARQPAGRGAIRHGEAPARHGVSECSRDDDRGQVKRRQTHRVQKARK